MLSQSSTTSLTLSPSTSAFGSSASNVCAPPPRSHSTLSHSSEPSCAFHARTYRPLPESVTSVRPDSRTESIGSDSASVCLHTVSPVFRSMDATVNASVMTNALLRWIPDLAAGCTSAFTRPMFCTFQSLTPDISSVSEVALAAHSSTAQARSIVCIYPPARRRPLGLLTGIFDVSGGCRRGISSPSGHDTSHGAQRGGQHRHGHRGSKGLISISVYTVALITAVDTEAR